MHLTNTIEEDFYGTPPKQEIPTETDILQLLKNNPEMRKKALDALLAEFS